MLTGNSSASLIENPKNAVVGPRQLYPNGDYQYSYGDLPGIKLGIKKLFLLNHIMDYLEKRNWYAGKYKIKNVSYIDGAVLAVKRKVFKDVKGFDEDYFFYTEEADFCLRVENLGYKVVHNPNSVVIHHRGATDKSNNLNEKRLRQMVSSKVLFCRKHLSFQISKFYMICEILYSFNMSVLWTFKHFWSGLLTEDKSKMDSDKVISTQSTRSKTKMKIEYNRLMFHIWLDEFNNFLRTSE